MVDNKEENGGDTDFFTMMIWLGIATLMLLGTQLGAKLWKWIELQ